MTIAGVARIAAVAIAVVGAADPAWVVRQRQPIPLEVVGVDGSRVSNVRGELSRRLGQAITFDARDKPAERVVVGDPSTLQFADDPVPVSTVAPDPESPSLRIVRAENPPVARLGWAATIVATVEARGLAGTTSAIVIESRGVELSRTEHKWTADSERYTVSLRYTPPREGESTVTVRAIQAERETSVSHNAVDVAVVATAKRLKILVYEPRPSWNATFVRRALEDDQTFEVSSAAGASKGLTVRAGSPPAVLTADALSPFDAVVIGAPEELRQSEVDALRVYARRRGGAIVLVPDRRPAGRYLELMPSPSFDEVLIDQATALTTGTQGRLRASEMAVYRTPDVGLAAVLASAELGKASRPVVLEWLAGEGRVLFSGALDAWRYRGSDDDGFSRFWRTRVAEAAEAAPPRASVSIDPGVPGVGEDALIHVRLRSTELKADGDQIRVPAVRLQVADEKGGLEIVRLWPTAEAGTFEGRVSFPQPGDYSVSLVTDSGMSVERRVVVAAAARHAAQSPQEIGDALRLVAAATGGVAVTESDLAPLERHLRSLPAVEVERSTRPWRSPWTVVAFAALLSIEWATRRRRGLP